MFRCFDKAVERTQDAEIAAIKENRFITERERKARLYNAYLALELNLKERIKIAEELRDVAVASDKDSSNAAHAQSRVDSLKTQQDVTLPTEIATNKPTSMFDEVRVEMKNLQDGFQTVATTIGGVMRSAIDGIAGSMAGLIQGTMTWAEALRNIGGSIINSVISGISRMFAEWVIGIAARKGAEIAAGAAETAATTPAPATRPIRRRASRIPVAADFHRAGRLRRSPGVSTWRPGIPVSQSSAGPAMVTE